MEDSKKSELIDFSVKYNGKAVESNEMDANAVATSLLGLSNAIETANSILNSSDTKISIKVRGSFRPGSFIIDITSFYNIPHLIQTVFNSGNIGTIADVTAILGFVVACKRGADKSDADKSDNNVKKDKNQTLIWLYKQTKGKKILTKKSLDVDNCEITVEGCDNPIVVNVNIVKLYENKKMQQAFANVVSPLEDEEMSDITFLVDRKEQEKILREERSYFHLIDTDIIDEKEDIDSFLITQSNFEGKQNGWRLSFVDSPRIKNKPDDFPVKILDENFLYKVLRKEIIISSVGTIMEARYRMITHKNERLTASYEIIEILNKDALTHNHNNHTRRPVGNGKNLNDF